MDKILYKEYYAWKNTQRILCLEYYDKILDLDLLRYPLAREGVYAPGGPALIAHTKQKVINIVGLTALRLAFSMGY